MRSVKPSTRHARRSGEARAERRAHLLAAAAQEHTNAPGDASASSAAPPRSPTPQPPPDTTTTAHPAAAPARGAPPRATAGPRTEGHRGRGHGPPLSPAQRSLAPPRSTRPASRDAGRRPDVPRSAARPGVRIVPTTKTRTCCHVGAVKPLTEGCIHLASLAGTSRLELPSRISPPNRFSGETSPATDQRQILGSITFNSTPASRENGQSPAYVCRAGHGMWRLSLGRSRRSSAAALDLLSG